jgi:uncharacterized protein YegP (UPF0339 family)
MSKQVIVAIYIDEQHKYRWRCRLDNKLFSRSSRGYEIESFLIEDLYYIAKKDHDAELYIDAKGRWRWRFKRDDKIIAISSSSYDDKDKCKYASDLLLDAKLID